jgi:hypothetical protein
MRGCPPADSAGVDGFPAKFEGKDPNDPEFRALRDQLAEKRRKREARKKAREERQKERVRELKVMGKRPAPNAGAARGTSGRTEDRLQRTDDERR